MPKGVGPEMMKEITTSHPKSETIISSSIPF